MSLKALPIGKSSFREIIEGNYAYVDKTEYALSMILQRGYYFISRPRRFGKSLFLDTLATIFSGDKALFEGLYIYERYDFPKHPVIKISLNDGSFKSLEQLQQNLFEILQFNQRQLGVDCDHTLSLSGCFRELIHQAHKTYQAKVVVLVDEYDKPILDNIENTQLAQALRDELKGFYSVIKGADAYLQLVFMTGVSKFSKVSLFSGLNNLEDITLTPRYATLCGYTQHDIETVFAEHLKGQDFDRIRQWYNGYQWLGEGVYNPFDILLFISNEFAYRNYWFSTGTPSFLLKVLEQNRYYLPNLERIIADDRLLDSFDVGNIQFEPLLWQTGYLTISHTETLLDQVEYHLSIPNREVQQSLFGVLAQYLADSDNSVQTINPMLRALLHSDFETLKTQLISLYASIPYEHFTHSQMHQYEGYYVAVFYAYMKALGLEVIGEDVTDKGRIDLTMKLPDQILIIEFKVDAVSADQALAQIKDKNYAQKYQADARPVTLMGIAFDRTQKNVADLQTETATTV